MSSVNRYPIWNGYRPFPKGKSQAYHVKKSPVEGSWAISCLIGDAEYFCVPGRGSDTDAALKGAVNLGAFVGIPPGGTLTINEHKDVVKTAYSQQRGINAKYLVANSPGFHVVFPGLDGPIDNSDDSGLEIGSPWPFQRVGMRYHYRPSDDDILMIYGNWEMSITVSFKKFFDFDFQYVLDQLAAAKNGRGGQFYVNEHGLMFAPTSEDAGGEIWRPVYAGRIDYGRWVSQEWLRANWDRVLDEKGESA